VTFTDCPSEVAADNRLSRFSTACHIPKLHRVRRIYVTDSGTHAMMSTVLRMLSSFVGEDRFLKGVSIYLKNKLYGNSVTTDLWNGISKATGIDVPKIMDNWVTKVMKDENCFQWS